MANTNDQEPRVDGRALRSVRTRRTVIEAFLDLVNEGVERPTSQEVAERSGVSPSTIFRLFEDLDGMYTEALSIQAERVADLIVPIPPEGAMEDRVERQVRARSRLYERVAPLIRFQFRLMPRSAGARANRQTVNSYFRDQLATLFAEELREAPDGTLDAIDAFTSWEMWERLRATQGLSAKRAEAIVRTWVASALASGR
jgi:AcrR family transcriptional regulator